MSVLDRFGLAPFSPVGDNFEWVWVQAPGPWPVTPPPGDRILPALLPPVWFAGLRAYGRGPSSWPHAIYADRGAALAEAVAAWDRLAEVDRTTLELVLTGRTLAASL